MKSKEITETLLASIEPMKLSRLDMAVLYKRHAHDWKTWNEEGWMFDDIYEHECMAGRTAHALIGHIKYQERVIRRLKRKLETLKAKG